MAKKHVFTGVIEDAGGGGAFVRIPFDVEAAFGSKRPKIKADIAGQPYRGTLVRMGSPYHMLLILKEIRERTGKAIGDKVKIVVEADEQPRTVALPADLAKELKRDKTAGARFDELSYTHRKEYVRWIEEAKRPETRQARLLKTLADLKKSK